MATLLVSVCLVVYSVFSVSGDSTVIIKGLYCKDPDDSTYHPVNSTWRSSTFCGNYTCKIRKKNDTMKSDIFINPTNQGDDDQVNAGSEHYFVKEKNSEKNQNQNDTDDKIVDLTNYNYTLKRDELIKRFEDSIIASLGEKGDRYLNTAEINSITDLLHTVKKSDLEAILEVYTLAKDIFNEIDETTMENLADGENLKITSAERDVNKLSYFFDPYAVAHSQSKYLRDSEHDTSNTVNAVLPTPTYNGPFLRHYNEKLLEYYPTSDFHRTSSYYHPYASTQSLSTSPAYAPNKYEQNLNGSCCPQSIANSFIASYITERKSKPQFIPYPLTYILKNNVAYPFDTNPWTQPYLNPLAYTHQTQYLGPAYINKLQAQPVYPLQLVQPSQTVSLSQPVQPRPPNDYQTEVLEEIYGAPHKSKLIEKLVPTEASKPSWQTGQLSPEIIDDIRANILQKTEKILNIIPRKKIKLERVAKVLKIDELARSKRETADGKQEAKQVDDNEKVLEEYEAYIERQTCGPSIEPGYFRVGNMSQPFPLCCPQKIEKR